MAAKQRKGVTDAAAAESQRLNIRISPDAYRRLGVHAIMAGMTPGKLVEKLIETHCREWKVQANSSARVTTEDRPERADSVSAVVIPANL